MANTYKLHINAVDAHASKNQLEKVIYNVYWTLFGENEDKVQSFVIGNYELGDPDPENFTSYENLTQDDVVQWIEPHINIDELKREVDFLISQKVKPSKLTLRIPVSLEGTTTEETV